MFSIFCSSGVTNLFRLFYSLSPFFSKTYPSLSYYVRLKLTTNQEEKDGIFFAMKEFPAMSKPIIFILFNNDGILGYFIYLSPLDIF